MKMEELRHAIGVVDQTRHAYVEACKAAWAALRRCDPQLAEDIASLWSKDDAAARWLCRPQGSDLSTAELILAGKADVVRGMILRAEHGFVG